MTADYEKKVETVARAIAGGFEWEMMTEPGRELRRGEARAALAALAIHPDVPAPNETKDQYRARLIEAIEAFPAPAPAISGGETGWQPIESAPFDKDLILGWWRAWPTVEWETKVGWAGSTKPHAGWRDGEAQFWMPCPAPPALAAAGQKP